LVKSILLLALRKKCFWTWHLAILEHWASSYKNFCAYHHAQFAKDAEAWVDGTPVIGHVKGSIHILAGDEDRGKQIIEGKKM
jgi:hypothetical protein